MIRSMFLLAALSSAAFAQSGGAVAGRIVNSATGEPVSGAIVTLQFAGAGSAEAETYIAQTGADGRFSISHIAPGLYDVRPSRDGYAQTATGRLATAKDFPPVLVEEGKTAPPLNLRLIPEGVIAGRVIDSTGDPVRRAMVLAQQYGYVNGKKQLRNVSSRQTDDRGEYRLFHLAPGKYWVYVEPAATRNSSMRAMIMNPGQTADLALETGLSPAYYPDSADAAHASQLDLAPGAELDGIDVRLSDERLYSIRGRFALDGPPRGVSIIAESPAGSRLRRSFPTRFLKGNQYEIAGLPPGTYAVVGQSFPAPDQKDAVRQYARQVVEVADRDVNQVDLVFAPCVTVKGVIKAQGVVDRSGPGFINLIPVDTGPQLLGGLSGRIEADGSFKVEAPPGVYWVRANYSQAYVKSMLIGNDPAPGGRIDTARLNGDITVVMSSDFGKVEGTVVDDSGKPVFNADVTLIPDQNKDDWEERFYNALTRADGKFSIANLEPGEYRVYAWLNVEQGAPQDPDFRKPFEDRAVAVKVEPNGAQTLELKVIDAGAR